MLAIVSVVLMQTVASGREKIVTEGLGAFSCAQFGKDYQKSPEIWESVFFSWAEGYMSALNTALLLRDATATDLRKWSVERQEDFLRSYCDQHPLEDYQDAVQILFSDMRKDQKLGNWLERLSP